MTTQQTSLRALGLILCALPLSSAPALAQAPPEASGAPLPPVQPLAPPPIDTLPSPSPPLAVVQPGRAPAVLPAPPPPAPPWPARAWAPPAPLEPLPPPPVARPVDGVTAKGLPYAQRGGVSVDAAGLVGLRTTVPATTTDVLFRIPVADYTLVDLTLPLAFGAMGNPMLGLRHVFRVDERLWVTLGGAFGFPLVDGTAIAGMSAARAYWDHEEFARKTVPFALRTGLEFHHGEAEVRVQLEPVAGIPIDGHVDPLLAIQHAVELQFGHTFGGGLRYQGVGMVSKGFSFGDDRYQGALEPFVRLQRDPLFARLGLLMPLDKPLGKPFDNCWGVRVLVGFAID